MCDQLLVVNQLLTYNSQPLAKSKGIIFLFRKYSFLGSLLDKVDKGLFLGPTHPAAVSSLQFSEFLPEQKRNFLLLGEINELIGVLNGLSQEKLRDIAVTVRQVYLSEKKSFSNSLWREKGENLEVIIRPGLKRRDPILAWKKEKYAKNPDCLKREEQEAIDSLLTEVEGFSRRATGLMVEQLAMQNKDFNEIDTSEKYRWIQIMRRRGGTVEKIVEAIAFMDAEKSDILLESIAQLDSDAKENVTEIKKKMNQAKGLLSNKT